VCGAVRNYAGYFNPELDKLVDQQSMEPDPVKAQADSMADQSASSPSGRSRGALLPGWRAAAVSPGSRA